MWKERERMKDIQMLDLPLNNVNHAIVTFVKLASALFVLVET